MNGPSKRIRVAWILIPLCILGAGALTFTTRFKNVTKTKHEFRQVIEDHDWKKFTQMVVPIQLQSGVMPPEKLQAFLDRYVDKSNKLDVFETKSIEQTDIGATFTEDHVGPSRRNMTSKLGVQITSDRNVIPGLPPKPQVKYEFTMTFVFVAMHEFPGTEQFDPHHWTAAKFPNQSKNYLPSQYLFAVREKKNLEAMGMPTYWNATVNPGTWDHFISSLRSSLKHDGWDVNALLKAYKLTDSEAPAKDSRRP